MQRRRFVQAVTAGSAAAGALTAQQAPPPAAEPVKIATVPAEGAAEATARFFTPRQLATLRHCALLLQPSMNGRPGAIEAGAPEFLDFLIGVSPEPRQKLYRGGLDFLETEAGRLFGKAFAELSGEQADKILRPLLAPWTFEPPADPRQRFMTELRADLRTATQNSKTMSESAAGGARRGRGRGPGGAGLYWLPIDPTR
jgi:hypothetical protein